MCICRRSFHTLRGFRLPALAIGVAVAFWCGIILWNSPEGTSGRVVSERSHSAQTQQAQDQSGPTQTPAAPAKINVTSSVKEARINTAHLLNEPPVELQATEVTVIVDALLLEQQPDLPPETAALVSARLAEAIRREFHLTSAEDRERVLESLKLMGPEIGRFPYDVSEERLAWSLDYLDNKVAEWAMHFEALTGPAKGLLASPEAMKLQTDQLQAKYALSIGSICGNNVEVVSRAVQELGAAYKNSSKNYFSPQVKFLMDAGATDVLDQMVEDRLDQIEVRLEREEALILEREDISEEERNELIERARLNALQPVKSAFHSAFGSSIPLTYVEITTLPEVVVSNYSRLAQEHRRLEEIEEFEPDPELEALREEFIRKKQPALSSSEEYEGHYQERF